ncbi:MAG: hypothetical protein PF542_03315 [Nanoarchaeota archaeon]|jgi:capsule polysaccharide export protein KpsE/RkpR|nr:hypothetical protein [Nanoarchaeota archaeon]
MKKIKNKKVQRKNKSKHIFYSKYLLWAAVVFALILIILTFVEFVSFDFISKSFEKPHSVDVRDECSLIMGNLVHQIRDDNDCSLRCKNTCGMEDTEYVNSSFIAAEADCHTCNCYCK